MDFTPLSIMGRSCGWRINKEPAALNNTMLQMNLIDIFRAFYMTTAKYTFSNAYGKSSRIDNMLVHKTSLDKSKKVEIMPSIFFDHNDMMLEMNNEENWKTHKYMEIVQQTVKQPIGQEQNHKGN